MYGDMGWEDDDQGGWDHCYRCGSSSGNGWCKNCDDGPKQREIRPEDVGFYVSGWIWDPEYPDLQHRSLHSFGPFPSEQAAGRVMENLAGPTDDSDLKPSMWEIKASDVPVKRERKDEEFFRGANGVKSRLPLAKRLHHHRERGA